jgi:shikimate kinase
MKENIVLIGFMGSGKTTVGKRLANLLGCTFIDTDLEIELNTGLKISEIFRKYGEKRFRAEEAVVVQRASSASGIVIATGGGVVLQPDNMARLRQTGYIILLEATPEVIAKRIQHQDVRPLLQINGNPEALIERLIAERAPDYSNCDLKVDTSELNLDQVAAQIRQFMQARGWHCGEEVADEDITGEAGPGRLSDSDR